MTVDLDLDHIDALCEGHRPAKANTMFSAPLDPDRLHCELCKQVYPCSTIQLADALRTTRTQLAEMTDDRDGAAFLKNCAMAAEDRWRERAEQAEAALADEQQRCISEGLARQAAEARLTDVLAEHQDNGHGWCQGCPIDRGGRYINHWPCPTVRAASPTPTEGD